MRRMRFFGPKPIDRCSNTFLEEMKRAVPWAELVKDIQPIYPKGEDGRPPKGLED